MDRYQYHIVYKTTNIVNNKIYIGMHSTNNLEDGYLGSGWVLKDAIRKYGRDKFVRTVLYVFHSRKAARVKEAEIVDAEFVTRKDTYNTAIGGMGVEDQWGERNPMYGKQAPNAKRVRATHKDGSVVEADSLQKLSLIIQIDRANLRNLLIKQIRGKRGWRVELIES